MNLAAMIGVVIGLAFVYLLLSLICSTIQEWIAAILRRRGATLHEGLLALLRDQTKVDALYAHPLIQSLMPPKQAATLFKGLSYMPSGAFASAVLETVVPDALTPGVNLSQTIAAASIPDHLKGSLMALANRVGGDRDRFIGAVENWFEDTMDRASGWYRRRTQAVIIVISVITTVVLNVDTVRLAQELYKNAGLREAVNATANEYLAAHPQRPSAIANTDGAKGSNLPSTKPAAGIPTDTAPPTTAASASTPSTTSVSTAAVNNTASGANATPTTTGGDYAGRIQGYLDSLTKLNLPIGWTQRPATLPIVGWLLTIIAVSLGAPFWFDVLLRISNLRAAGPKPPRSSGR
jgi:hypothetical protein